VSKLNPSDLIGLRRSLMSLASLMLLMVLTTGVAGLFATWSLSGFHQRMEKKLTEASVVIDEARSIHATFKVQVQEWKNILLRGQDLASRERYAVAFRAQGKKTTDLLLSLPDKVDRLKLAGNAGPGNVPFQLADAVNLPEILAELQALNLAYESALVAASGSGAKDGWDPMLADRLVRGADRTVGERMEAIPFALIKAVNATLIASQEQGTARFETLLRFVWTAIALALAMVAIMIWRILRHPALAR
jgi:hypothetical protein